MIVKANVSFKYFKVFFSGILYMFSMKTTPNFESKFYVKKNFKINLIRKTTHKLKLKFQK